MLSTAFVAATNHLLARAPWARERLAPHAERRARLSVEPATTIDFSIDGHGYLAASGEEGEPEVTLSLPASQIPRLVMGQMDEAMRSVRVEGNAELADALGFVFRHLRWDVEEDLSRVLGDVAAHRLVGAGTALRQTGARAFDNLGSNLGEYLTEESRLLVTHPGLRAHEDDLRALRDDLARLEKRIDRVAAAAGRTTGRG